MLMLMPDQAMTRKRFKAALKALGMTQADFAAFWHTNPQVVGKWGATYKGGVGFPYWVGPALELMRSVREGGFSAAPQASMLLVPQRRMRR